MQRWHSLNPEEARIIESKGTERPQSGAYNHFYEEGVYCCKRCDQPLYLSKDKFDSHCGWPSFDEALPNAILEVPDGERTEMVCARCHAHLGHVFKGERLTAKNTRHCVNSLSMTFLPAKTQEGLERALLAGGCFWGVQELFDQVKGVVSTTVGYCGGTVSHPIYKEVCSGKTGHREVIEILFDPALISFEELLQMLLKIKDPNQGEQYEKAIFCLTDKQRRLAEKYVKEVDVRFASTFYPAEEYHQKYYARK